MLTRFDHRDHSVNVAAAIADAYVGRGAPLSWQVFNDSCLKSREEKKVHKKTDTGSHIHSNTQGGSPLA